MKLLFYVKKDKFVLSEVEFLYGDEIKTKYECVSKTKKGKEYLEQMGVGESLNGKIIMQCDLDVGEITYAPNSDEFDRCFFSPGEWCYDYCEKYGGLSNEDLLKRSCLSYDELREYFNTPTNEHKKFIRDTFGYTIYMRRLNVFDEDRDLSTVCTYDFWASEMFGINATVKDLYVPLTKAPSNMCRVYDTQEHYEMKILVPISSKEACNILNKKQDILIRRNVLKEMK